MTTCDAHMKIGDDRTVGVLSVVRTMGLRLLKLMSESFISVNGVLMTEKGVVQNVIMSDSAM